MFNREMFVFSSNLHHKFKGTHLGRYHFAITGKGWSIIQEHYSDLIPQIVVKGTIFARMSPDQKPQLVQELPKRDILWVSSLKFQIVGFVILLWH